MNFDIQSQWAIYICVLNVVNDGRLLLCTIFFFCLEELARARERRESRERKKEMCKRYMPNTSRQQGSTAPISNFKMLLDGTQIKHWKRLLIVLFAQWASPRNCSFGSGLLFWPSQIANCWECVACIGIIVVIDIRKRARGSRGFGVIVMIAICDHVGIFRETYVELTDLLIGLLTFSPICYATHILCIAWVLLNICEHLMSAFNILLIYSFED